uniref:Uncharacterized protein n=1 Tax=Rhodogorgon sp. TaxID=2485824 RepID=A0A3G3MI86_9FLOR|nr:hypothetical protein [Rhodogorgon sp.]
MILKQHFIPLYTVNKLEKYNKLLIIPVYWRLIIIGQGSLTQNLNSITGEKTYIHLISQKTRISKQNYSQNDITRQVWIKNKEETKLVFAESHWKESNTFFTDLTRQQPIGKSLIEFEIDFHKEIHQIQYGYSYILRKAFQTGEPIWSRRYTIWHNYKALVTIKEFFSHKLVKYLT